MAKLVAFYSRAGENYYSGKYRYVEIGNTEKVAKQIAALIGGDLFKIQQKVPYAEDYSTCIAQAKEHLKSNARPELIKVPENLDKYEEIYLGYPNYWGTMPMAVYTFLEQFQWTGKTIYPFCTHEGSGLSGTEKDIRRAAKGCEVKKGLAVHGSAVDRAGEQIEGWCKKCAQKE